MALNVGDRQRAHVKARHPRGVGHVPNQGVGQSVAVDVVEQEGGTRVLEVFAARRRRGHARTRAGVDDQRIPHPGLFDVGPAPVGPCEAESAILLILVPLDARTALVEAEHVDVAVLVYIANVGPVHAEHLEVVGRVARDVHGAQFGLGSERPAEGHFAVDALALPYADSVRNPAKEVGDSVAIVVHQVHPLLVSGKARRPFGAFYPASVDPFERKPAPAVAVKNDQILNAVAVEVGAVGLRIVESARSAELEVLAVGPLDDGLSTRGKGPSHLSLK